jgi:MEMO1 family protein
MRNRQSVNISIVPIGVGNTTYETERTYGRIFAEYLKDPSNVFVISSDFSHWGSRFGYTFHRKEWGSIADSIKQLDHLGIEAISAMDPEAFQSYMDKYRNTICGRRPISILLHVCPHPIPIALHRIPPSRADDVTFVCHNN